MKIFRLSAFLGSGLGLIVGLALIAGVAPTARAQDTTKTVIKSPYTDFHEQRALALLLGYFAGNRGRPGVGPQGSPLVGLSYLYHVGGPAGIVGRLSYAPSQRTVLDPALPPDQRDLGSTSAPLVMADVGLAFYFTGEKTWHHMVPTAGIALGLAFGSNTPDVGGYSFGTKFYFGFGGGVTYALKGPWVFKADAWDYLWQLKYPTTYFTFTPPVLPSDAPDKEWRNNGVITIGLSYTLKQ